MEIAWLVRSLSLKAFTALDSCAEASEICKDNAGKNQMLSPQLKQEQFPCTVCQMAKAGVVRCL